MSARRNQAESVGYAAGIVTAISSVSESLEILAAP